MNILWHLPDSKSHEWVNQICSFSVSRRCCQTPVDHSDRPSHGRLARNRRPNGHLQPTPERRASGGLSDDIIVPSVGIVRQFTSPRGRDTREIVEYGPPGRYRCKSGRILWASFADNGRIYHYGDGREVIVRICQTLVARVRQCNWTELKLPDHYRLIEICKLIRKVEKLVCSAVSLTVPTELKSGLLLHTVLLRNEGSVLAHLSPVFSNSS